MSLARLNNRKHVLEKNNYKKNTKIRQNWENVSQFFLACLLTLKLFKLFGCLSGSQVSDRCIWDNCFGLFTPCRKRN